MPADVSAHTNLKRSKLMVKLRYTNANGTGIADDSKVGPVNCTLFALFQQIRIALNDYVVSPPEQNPAYVNWLHYLIQPDAKKHSEYTDALFYDDTATTEEQSEQSDPYAAANINTGLKKRAEFFKGSKEVRMIGEIAIPPHQCNRLMLPGQLFLLFSQFYIRC